MLARWVKTLYILVGFLCAQVPSGNCETMESWEICNLTLGVMLEFFKIYRTWVIEIRIPSLHGHLDNLPRNQRETLRCGTISLNWKRRSNGKKFFIQEFRISQDFYENEKPLRSCIRVTCATKSFPWEPTVPTLYVR